MTAAPHGTFARYRAGCHDACCRRANALKTNLQRLGLSDHYLDGTGTRRRLRALRRIGWTNTHIADAAGLTERSVAAMLTTRSEGRLVLTTTATKVRTAYDRLSMRRGPIVVLTGRAASWPPPLAWDDETIDDPATQPAHELPDPTPITGRRGTKRVIHADAVTFLIDQGEPRAAIARHLGVAVGSLQKVLERHGHRDVWIRLCERDHYRRTNDVRRTAA